MGAMVRPRRRHAIYRAFTTLFNRFEGDNGRLPAADMPHRRNALTPEALAMIDTIARTGSFAAAARALDLVPSALTYRVRQIEDALDVLLFDRTGRASVYSRY